MIGGTLIRFHPDGYHKSGGLFGQVWKDIKARGPTMLKDVLKETAAEGLKGLNAGGKGGKPYWKGALAGVKRGATRAVKRKGTQEIQRVLGGKKSRKDLFGP